MINAETDALHENIQGGHPIEAFQPPGTPEHVAMGREPCWLLFIVFAILCRYERLQPSCATDSHAHA